MEIITETEIREAERVIEERIKTKKEDKNRKNRERIINFIARKKTYRAMKVAFRSNSLSIVPKNVLNEHIDDCINENCVGLENIKIALAACELTGRDRNILREVHEREIYLFQRGSRGIHEDYEDDKDDKDD